MKLHWGADLDGDTEGYRVWGTFREVVFLEDSTLTVNWRTADVG